MIASRLFAHTSRQIRRFYSQLHPELTNPIAISGTDYRIDHLTNVTPRILSKIGLNLHVQNHHPLNLILQRIKNYFYGNFKNARGNPIFAVFDNISPVVTVDQNFDSLLVPKDHASRSSADTYYINEDYLLRAHTSAHQRDLIAMGFNSFLVAGDVYRRDEIDVTHYPVFHQCEGVRLFDVQTLYRNVSGGESLKLFEKAERTPEKQETLTLEASKMLEHDLKRTLIGLSRHLFGKGEIFTGKFDIETRWVDCYFPFTHPSFELEIKYRGEWMEVLGCGVMEQALVDNAGATGRVGWAFGLGLERLAMRLYSVPDIRVFWSNDPGVRRQFVVQDAETPITYKPTSQYPPCICDISFWVAEPEKYSSNDFYDLVGSVAGDVMEHVELVDVFKHPQTGKVSHCYRLYYRHMDRSFTQAEVNIIHQMVASKTRELLNVEIR